MNRTELFKEHRALGAKIIDFHGWEMPIHFEAGIIEEHKTVRNSVGIFDVSHMGQIIVSGKDACQKLQTLYTNDIHSLEIGKAVYSHILNEEGKIIDDTIVYRLASDIYLAIPNASMIDVVFEWMRKHIPQGVENLSDRLSCFAVQGPRSPEVMCRLFGNDIKNIERFTFMIYDQDSQSNYYDNNDKSLNNNTGSNEIINLIRESKGIIIAKTGYTGEDGFELILNNEIALETWRKILESGDWFKDENGIKPIGLGARDTLRLEMGYLLSGQDFDGNQTPLECASSWVVKWDHDFIGRDALLAQKESESFDRLVGIQLEKRLAARQGALVFPAPEPTKPNTSTNITDTDGSFPVEMKGSPTGTKENIDTSRSPDNLSSQHIGTVTSGGFAPSLGKAIALARVNRQYSKKGTPVELEVKGRRLKGRIVRPPFIKK